MSKDHRSNIVESANPLLLTSSEQTLAYEINFSASSRVIILLGCTKDVSPKLQV